MISKVFDMVAKCLEAGDEVQFLFPSQHEGTSGYVVFSKEKMLYVEEDRVTHEANDLIFEIPLWQ
ncbi:MAG: hypothetical protein QG670_732 [Thermoproteota archaeon]|nr:hypothetical protein [Thermoproteota archaeon]